MNNKDDSINQNSNYFVRFNSRKSIFIREYKRKLVDLNYLDSDSRIDLGGRISEEFHTAIVKFLLDEGECDLAKIIMESEEIILSRGNNFDYCSNKLYSQDYKTSSGSTLDSRIIYLNYIFTDKFSTLLNKALKRVL